MEKTEESNNHENIATDESNRNENITTVQGNPETSSSPPVKTVVKQKKYELFLQGIDEVHKYNPAMKQNIISGYKAKLVDVLNLENGNPSVKISNVKGKLKNISGITKLVVNLDASDPSHAKLIKKLVNVEKDIESTWNLLYNIREQIPLISGSNPHIKPYKCSWTPSKLETAAKSATFSIGLSGISLKSQPDTLTLWIPMSKNCDFYADLQKIDAASAGDLEGITLSFSIIFNSIFTSKGGAKLNTFCNKLTLVDFTPSKIIPGMTKFKINFENQYLPKNNFSNKNKNPDNYLGRANPNNDDYQ